VTHKCLWSVVLMAVLCLNLVKPANASSLPSNGTIIGGLVAAIAAVAVVILVVVYEVPKKRAITGCVSSGPNGMTITDEKDKRVYALSGATAGITAGERMKLSGKKVKTKSQDKTLQWETKNVSKDFGVCQP
jgi:hypothetical protein